MPKFDERFARQYRYELPPGFPLASPNPGIGHHLSGLHHYAQARTSWSAAVSLELTAIAFTARKGLPPIHSHNGLTPWSVFQDGSPVRGSLDKALDQSRKNTEPPKQQGEIKELSSAVKSQGGPS